MADLTLYSMPSSGNSYKVRLLLAFLGTPYTHVGLEYATTELAEAHADGALPLKKLPVLRLADGTTLPESNAILHYLAEGTAWLPSEPLARAQVLSWMFWEQNQHEGVIAVRAALLHYAHRKAEATTERLTELLERGQDLLQQMENRLADRAWFVGDEPSIADIALYAYTHTAESLGGFSLDPFPNVRAWLASIEALPGYVVLNDIPT